MTEKGVRFFKCELCVSMCLSMWFVVQGEPKYNSQFVICVKSKTVGISEVFEKRDFWIVTNV